MVTRQTFLSAVWQVADINVGLGHRVRSGPRVDRHPRIAAMSRQPSEMTFLCGTSRFSDKNV